jgi:putative transposase
MKLTCSDLERNILAELQSGTRIGDAFKPMIKRIMEAALDAEMELHLEDNPDIPNLRAGKSRKTIKTSNGTFELETPRDRDSSFEPQLVKKRERVLTDDGHVLE